MSTNDPNPLQPQGSLQQASAKAKSNLRLAFFIVAVVHVALIGGILMVGCKKEEPVDTKQQQKITSALPPLDPSYYPAASSTGTPASATTDTLAGLPPLAPPDTNTGVAGAPAGVGTLPPPPGGTTPVTTATDVPPPAPDASEYTIARGDTFYGIAKKHGVSMNAVTKANPGVDPTRLRPGQKIKIPAKAATSAAAPVDAGAGIGATAGNGDYTVKSGDSLTRIAKNHKTTVAALKGANNLRTDRINVGQKLKIPAGAAPAVEAPPSTPAPAAPVTNAAPPSGGALPVNP